MSRKNGRSVSPTPSRTRALRTEVHVLDVLDREVVQAEAVLYLGQFRHAWLEQSEPYKSRIIALAEVGRMLELHRSVMVAAAVAITRAVDDQGAPSNRSWACGGAIVA
jgi:hypothetical protein